MESPEDIAQAERWMDSRPASPNSTVVVIWQPQAPDHAPVTIAATHQDALDWAKEQPDTDSYSYTEWRVIGEGSSADGPAAPGSTVWAVWDGRDGADLAPIRISSTHHYARQWADEQADPSIYCFTVWRVLGAGWPGVTVLAT